MTDTFIDRLDYTALEKLCEKEKTGPVDALNLVRLSGRAGYRWYGLLLSPLVLLRGGRPLLVAAHEKSLVGEKIFDEIVIVRYPGLKTFSGILTGRYYSLLNRLREKGVDYFEFSFTRSLRDSRELWKKGLRLVVRFNYRNRTFGDILDKITNILGEYPVLQLYASRQIGVIPFKSKIQPADPNPDKYEGMVIFTILKNDSEEFNLDKDSITELKGATAEISADIYRSLGIWESMPWVRH